MDLLKMSGQNVTAMTPADPDRDLPPRRVTGVLSARRVEGMGYVQCDVDGLLVDERTVRPVGGEAAP
jgi:hypothetical protein